MDGLRPVRNQVEENTKLVKQKYVGYVGKIELERIAEGRFV
jgi:hypothetical protein